MKSVSAFLYVYSLGPEWSSIEEEMRGQTTALSHKPSYTCSYEKSMKSSDQKTKIIRFYSEIIILLVTKHQFGAQKDNLVWSKNDKDTSYIVITDFEMETVTSTQFN